MKYVVEAIIYMPRDKVVELFDNPDNMYHWHENLVNLELISGVKGQAGAKSKLVYKFLNYKIEVIQTVQIRDLSNKFACTYEIKGLWNRVADGFIELDANRTIWIHWTDFRCTGFLKIVSFLMPGIFRKISLMEMKEFKEFAESYEFITPYKLHTVR